ncbi:aromatic amino acid transporter AroP, partial [Enterobacter hormaechei]
GMLRTGRETVFKAVIYRGGKYVFIPFLGVIVVLMATMDELRLSAMLLRVGVVFVFIGFKITRKK